MAIYYIQNTYSEWSSSITAYFTSLNKAKDALRDCCDWYRPKGTGKIYKVEENVLHPVPELVYQN